MTDETRCAEVGCMTPAQVVQCAEGSTKECWYAAATIAEDGSRVAYECCGGAGKKARFSVLRKGSAPCEVSAAEVPSSLTWVQRSMV